MAGSGSSISIVVRSGTIMGAFLTWHNEEL